ncbi:MAG: hypothetical protein LBV69_04245 [Bacteroidales bacterium]|jgi:hypothetical protein|nr:hypothetical protein [Bacteroidales bacterium]
MITIKNYNGENNEILIRFLSQESFMVNSNSPRDSTISSILDYQKKTNNYGQQHGTIMINNKEEIVGFLGNLAFPAKYENKNFIAVQTTSAFIDKNYPGNFKKFINSFILSNEDTIKFSILPTEKIFSSFEKCGFVQVNKQRFNKQYYVVISPKEFLNEFLQKKEILKFISKFLFWLIPHNSEQTYKNNNYHCKLMLDFNNDYSQIEMDYEKRMYSFFSPVWNKNILENKFGNKLLPEKKNLKENEIFHFCCYNSTNEIIGSIVVKKIRNFNRLIISDIQTISNNQSFIVKSLIIEVLCCLKEIDYNSLMFYGIEEYYSAEILKNFKYFVKNTDKRIYYKPNNKIPPEKINFVFSDDDMNF